MAIRHHLFLSYARTDNQPVPPATCGWVAAFNARLEQRHRAFSGQKLEIFYDAESLREGDDWETRIGQALRSSQLLLAFLSPAFLKSEWCRREWEEYLRLEHSLSRSEGGIVPVYFAYAPELDPKAQVELEEQFGEWVADIDRVQRGQLIDIRPWYDGGAEALELLVSEERLASLAAHPRADARLQPQDFVDQLAGLDRAIAARLDLALLAEQAESGGFLTASYEHFVGRGRQLRDLHRKLSAGHTSLIAALHGLGGQGKSALAVQYAYAYAGHYACGGRWLVGCEGKTSLLAVFETLAALIGRPLSEAEALMSPDAQMALYAQRFRAHYAEGKARIVELLRQQGGPWFTPVEDRALNIEPRMLIILDNVDQPELLSANQLGAFPKQDGIDFLVTSRLGPDELGLDEKGAIEIGDLPEADALALLRARHPFADAVEETAARELVRMVWGHVLSVDLIGAHVAAEAKAGYSYAQMRDVLAAAGAGVLEAEALDKARGAVRAADTAKTIGAIMSQTWAQLSEADQRVLEYASLCPPDLVPTDWLRRLLQQEFAELAPPEGPSLIADPWDRLLAKLDDRRLLTANPVEEGAEPAASIHRLVAEVVRARMGTDKLALRREGLIGLADAYGTFLEHNARFHPGMARRWLAPLTDLTRALIDPNAPDRRLTGNIGVCADFAMNLNGIAAAQSLLEERQSQAEALALANPGDAQAQRDLSVSQSKLGDFYLRRGAAGDADRALAAYEAALATAEALALANPGDAQAQRDLSVSQNKLGDFYLRRGAAGDADRALAAYEAALATAEALALANPGDAQAQRDLSVSQSKLGDFYLRRGAAGDADRALAAYEASLATDEALALANPGDAQAQRDLSVSQSKLGDFYLRRGAAGDAVRALAAYEAALATAEALALANPGDAQAQRDLSVSQNKLGDFYLRRGAAGDAVRALAAYEAALATAEALALANPGDAQAQRDLSVSQNKLGDFYLRRGAAGDADRALAAYEAALATAEALALANPGDAQAQRDLSVSQERLGDFYLRRGAAGDAERALAAYEAALATREALALANPGDALAQRDLSVSQERLGNFYLRRGAAGDAVRALAAYEAALATAEALALANPGDAQAQRDLSVSQERLGDFYLRRGAAGDAERALEFFQAAAALRRVLAQTNPGAGALQAELCVPLMRLAQTLLQLEHWDAFMHLIGEMRALVAHWDLQGFEPDGRVQAVRDLLRQVDEAEGKG